MIISVFDYEVVILYVLEPLLIEKTLGFVVVILMRI
jgi:hypothetical protein